MLKMLTDEQLNPMRRGAPLLAEEYRKLRERMLAAATLMAASEAGLRGLREALAEVQARETGLRTALRSIERHVGNDAEFDAVWDASGAQDAIAQPTDRTALDAMLAEARHKGEAVGRADVRTWVRVELLRGAVLPGGDSDYASLRTDLAEHDAKLLAAVREEASVKALDMAHLRANEAEARTLTLHTRWKNELRTKGHGALADYFGQLIEPVIADDSALEKLLAAERVKTAAADGYAASNAKKLAAAETALAAAQAQVVALRETAELLSRVGNRIVLTVPSYANPHHHELVRAVGLSIAPLAAKPDDAALREFGEKVGQRVIASCTREGHENPKYAVAAVLRGES